MKQERLDRWIYRQRSLNEMIKEIGKHFYLEKTSNGFNYVPKDEIGWKIWKRLEALGEIGISLLLLSQPYMEERK